MCRISKRNLRQYLNIVPVALITFALGAGIGWASPALVFLSTKPTSYSVSEADFSWIAASQFGLETVIPIVAGLCSAKTGRKPIIVCGAILMVLSWLTIIFARSAATIILSRALLGMAAGFHEITWNIYLGEFASPDLRGVLGSVMTLTFTTGVTFELLLGVLVSYESLAVVPLIVSVLALLGAFFLVESPYVLLMHNHEKKALRNLTWLRDANEELLLDEFREMKHYIEAEKHTSRSVKHFLHAPSEYKTFLIGIFIYGLMNCCGYMTITHYQGIILDRFDGMPSGNNLALIFGVVTLLSTCISPFVIERAGRRALLIYGFFISFIVETCAAILFFIDQYYPYALPFLAHMLIVLFNAQGVLFLSFILPPSCVIKGELFPQEIKVLGSVLATVANAIVQFVILGIYVYVSNAFGEFVNYLIYSIACLLISICIHVVLSETTGISLAQIQNKASAQVEKPLRDVLTSLM